MSVKATDFKVLAFSAADDASSIAPLYNASNPFKVCPLISYTSSPRYDNSGLGAGVSAISAAIPRDSSSVRV